ncbi:ABC transporter substrate-binding protein [Oceanisphaera pacifica]|uniref:ABC transporter substrate-binding protein n=1 Tax=Oceanisphaera pacifica TaxID=2818389 RepID=A0ABS3NIH1_9GAMM|nr:ABC transporter substrate-binding protein [Oceanisphaera pacifica]MBO1520377.1 ABC transporter substrate-binding protein [Oceanisphaera pacifica]
MKKKTMTSVLIAVSVMLSACNDTNQHKKNTQQADPVTVRVASWSQPITEQTNLLVKDKDFFKKNNIDVEFIPGAGGGDAIKNIASGKADIAFTDPGSFFSALDKGEKLLALYNIYPQNVFNVVSLADSDITQPQDLKGKKVGVYSLSSGTRQNLLMLLHQVGLTEDDVEIIETGVLNFSPLMQGQVDATAATDTGLATGKAKGLGDVNVIEVKEIFNYSSDLFVVTEQAYQQKKSILDDFLASYKDSVQWMMAEPEAAAELAVSYAIDGKNTAHNLRIINLRNASSMPISQDKTELGLLDPQNLQDVANHYYQLGLISQQLDISSAISSQYRLPTE